MKAPVKELIRKVLADPKAARELMQGALESRNPELQPMVVINGERYRVKRIVSSDPK